MGPYYVLWRKPQPTCPSDNHRRLLDQSSRAVDRGASFQWNLAARAASKRPNCKGPPGLSCAVTPQGTCPPCVQSKPSTIMTILGRSVCPVVNSYEWRPKRTSRCHVLAGQLRCGPWIDARSAAHRINISALDISPPQLYAQLVSNIPYSTCTQALLASRMFLTRKVPAFPSKAPLKITD